MKLVIFLISFISIGASAQVNLDSLWGVWNDESLPDTSRLEAITDICWDGYLFTKPDSALYFAQILYNFAKRKDKKKHVANALNIQGIASYNLSQQKAALKYYTQSLSIREEIGDEIGVAGSLNNIGNIYHGKSDYVKALDYYTKSLKIREKINDKLGMAKSLINFGSINKDQGKYKLAIDSYFRCLKISEEIGNKTIEAAAKMNIGVVYKDQGDYDSAIKYYTEGLKIMEVLDNKVGVASALNNIGAIYRKQGDSNSALDYYMRSLKTMKKIGYKQGLATPLTNIGAIYTEQGNFHEAIEYFNQCLGISEEIGNQRDYAAALNNIGGIYKNLNDYKTALDYCTSSLDIAQKIGALVCVKRSAYSLWEINKNIGRHKDALSMYELFISTRDSLESEENQKEIIRQEYKYQYEKQAAADSIKTAEADKVKDAQLAAEQAENKQHELEAKQQEEQKMYLFGGLGLALLFGLFIFNRFRVTRKQKGIIEEQKHKVDEAYDELEEKNSEILDSINYAKRIQSAILPPSKLVKEYLNQSFILYKPKDIVAGDFYWMEPSEKGVLFAAADCTGHGVPGAMVSVVCNNGLNRSVREYGLTDPGQILDKTREIVIAEFEKSEEEVKDGMDIALCSLHGRTLHYAGAHNPLWIIRKDSTEVEEIKADKQPIGKYAEPKPYTSHTIELQEGDSFYIFSDGYADQFGGERGKKYKTANFKRLLLSIQNETIEKQKQLIDEAFEAWKGWGAQPLEQLDDVCVIGVRI